MGTDGLHSPHHSAKSWSGRNSAHSRAAQTSEPDGNLASLLSRRLAFVKEQEEKAKGAILSLRQLTIERLDQFQKGAIRIFEAEELGSGFIAKANDDRFRHTLHTRRFEAFVLFI